MDTLNARVGDWNLKEDEDADDPVEVVQKAIGDLEKTVGDRLKTIEEKAGDADKIGDRLDKIEKKLARPNLATGDDDEDAKIEKKAFDAFMRRGADALADDDRKALRVADNEAGGYLVPEGFETEILKGLVETSPIRTAASVRNTSFASVKIPRRTGRITGKWVGEIEDRPKTEPTYGQLEIPTHEMACYVDVSRQLLEDSAVDLEAELAMDFAEEFGRLEGEAFVNGDGVKKPGGLMADAAVPTVSNGHATVIQPDSLITLMYSLPAQYRNRGAWLLNSTTIATVRKLKDGQGNYLWQPAFTAETPETLLGRPIVEAVNFDDVEANAFPLAYGDIAAAYRIYDRIGLSVLRDPYTQATNGIVRFHARRRVGGAVVRPDAVRKLEMKA